MVFLLSFISPCPVSILSAKNGPWGRLLDCCQGVKGCKRRVGGGCDHNCYDDSACSKAHAAPSEVLHLSLPASLLFGHSTVFKYRGPLLHRQITGAFTLRILHIRTQRHTRAHTRKHTQILLQRTAIHLIYAWSSKAT